MICTLCSRSAVGVAMDGLAYCEQKSCFNWKVELARWRDTLPRDAKGWPVKTPIPEGLRQAAYKAAYARKEPDHCTAGGSVADRTIEAVLDWIVDHPEESGDLLFGRLCFTLIGDVK